MRSQVCGGSNGLLGNPKVSYRHLNSDDGFGLSLSNTDRSVVLKGSGLWRRRGYPSGQWFLWSK